MDIESLYRMIREISAGMAAKDTGIRSLPESIDPDALLADMGLDLAALPDLATELKKRLGNRDLGLERIIDPATINGLTVGRFLERVRSSLLSSADRPLIVYVDDEIQNLFVFTRKFGKRLNLKTFTDPEEALAFIKAEDSVALVITDEVMPKMTGNKLCDEVQKVKPKMKFVLITGNPNNDEDLLYKTLRRNRFYEFLNKPLDLEGKGEEYFNMIEGLITYDW